MQCKLESQNSLMNILYIFYAKSDYKNIYKCIVGKQQSVIKSENIDIVYL